MDQDKKQEFRDQASHAMMQAAYWEDIRNIFYSMAIDPENIKKIEKGINSAIVMMETAQNTLYELKDLGGELTWKLERYASTLGQQREELKNHLQDNVLATSTEIDPSKYPVNLSKLPGKE